MKNELTFGSLVQTIELVHGQMTTRAKRAVNISLTFRNWLIGFYVDEYELQGADRADYGDNLFDALAEALEPLDVSSSGKRQHYGYLAFYRAYPQIVRTVSAQLQPDVPDRERLKKKVRTVSAQSLDALNDEVVSRLSYSHFEVLVRLDTEKRAFYERECEAASIMNEPLCPPTKPHWQNRQNKEVSMTRPASPSEIHTCLSFLV